MWVLGFSQEKIEEQAIEKRRQDDSGRCTLQRQDVGHVRRREAPKYGGFVYGLDNFIG